MEQLFQTHSKLSKGGIFPAFFFGLEDIVAGTLQNKSQESLLFLPFVSQ